MQKTHATLAKLLIPYSSASVFYGASLCRWRCAEALFLVPNLPLVSPLFVSWLENMLYCGLLGHALRADFVEYPHLGNLKLTRTCYDPVPQAGHWTSHALLKATLLMPPLIHSIFFFPAVITTVLAQQFGCLGPIANILLYTHGNISLTWISMAFLITFTQQ